MEESQLKISPIASGSAVAFSGHVQYAFEIITFLKSNYGNTPDLRTLIDSLTASFGPFDRTRYVELLLATSRANGEAELLHWDTVRGLDSNTSDYYEIGSLTSYHSGLTVDILSRAVRMHMPPAWILAAITAVVQSYGIHHKLIDMNVGGAIFGLSTYAGIVSWQEDTRYILYNTRFINNEISIFNNINSHVLAYVRDDVLVVGSSLTKQTRIFENFTTPSNEVWIKTWLDYIKSHRTSNRFRNWVFISTVTEVVTVVIRTDFEQESRYLIFNNIGTSNFEILLPVALTIQLTTAIDSIYNLEIDVYEDAPPWRHYCISNPHNS
ncbi:MAG: hypothetical protein WA435_02920 [Gallionellaceae bacterium]